MTAPHGDRRTGGPPPLAPAKRPAGRLAHKAQLPANSLTFPRDLASGTPLRWARLARRADLDPEEPLVVALSGGADSVFLLHLIAAALDRPKIWAVHVDHGLRGAESRADADFCARLAASLSIPFRRVRVELDAAAPDLERRAREARYGALAATAREVGVATVATGHHADDALETLMMRWMRGTELSGLAGLKRRTRVGAALGAQAADAPVDIVRPLLDLRQGEIRAELRQAGIPWREDSSNQSQRFTRNRIRNQWLPEIERACGSEALDNLHAFHAAIEVFENELAGHTAHIHWRPPSHAAASRSRDTVHLGGVLERRRLVGLSPPLLRRTLWRLVSEGCGAAPSRPLLDHIAYDLDFGRCSRHSLPRGWSLQLRSDLLHLSPPAVILPTPTPEGRGDDQQLCLPFQEVCPLPHGEGTRGVRLALPGAVQLGDGRWVSAETVELSPGSCVPRSAVEIELEAPPEGTELWVRLPRPGDRFHGLGAPGSRPLRRFLADAGIPRLDRARVPLVFFGDELAWVVGVRPCQRYRVSAHTEQRLRLRLHDGAPKAPNLASSGSGQLI